MLKVFVIGALGKDCVKKEVNGKTVINFSVAHGEKWKDQQGNLKEKTTWVECAYWTDKTAVAQYLVKGKKVFVEGVPEADAYKNNAGDAKGTLRCRVMHVELLGGGEQNGSGNQEQQSSQTDREQQAAHAPVQADAIDDLPF